MSKFLDLFAGKVRRQGYDGLQTVIFADRHKAEIVTGEKGVVRAFSLSAGALDAIAETVKPEVTEPEVVDPPRRWGELGKGMKQRNESILVGLTFFYEAGGEYLSTKITTNNTSLLDVRLEVIELAEQCQLPLLDGTWDKGPILVEFRGKRCLI